VNASAAVQKSTKAITGGSNMNWFLAVLKKKYADFSGRAQRAEYWYFFLFYLIIYIVLAIIDGITGTYNVDASIGLLGGIFALALLIPSIAVGVRRLHDTGRSGWWLLIGLIPLIGAIVLLVFTVQDSSPGDNQYGPNPKEIAA
jgi:uncharacterized membrane protein YhaH (DUF805 family)